MSNPALTEGAFAKARDEEMAAGWAAAGGQSTQAPPQAPQPGTPYGGQQPGWPPQAGFGPTPPYIPQAPDEVSEWPPAPAGYQAMRTAGVASALGVMLAILVVAGWFGWQSVTVTDELVPTEVGEVTQRVAQLPGWIFVAWIAGFALAIVTVFKPKIARFTAAPYAIAQGLFMGSLSAWFETMYEGIVLQAVGLTIAVFALMLGLFAFRIIKVTDRMRTTVIVAAGAVMLLYLTSMALSFFGIRMPMIHDSGPIGIAFSLFVVGLAAFMLLVDFDLVERAVAAKAPRYMEWYAAFALMITLVWLYLEILRLLAKLRN